MAQQGDSKQQAARNSNKSHRSHNQQNAKQASGNKRRKPRNRGGNKRPASKPARVPARLPQTQDHILFVGFMGSGKTSVSRQVARRCGLPLIDVDTYIEQSQGRRIKQIFAQEGEAGFRRIESEALASLAYSERSIISCGGGVCSSAINRAIVKSLGTVVYLKVPLDEAVGRISNPSTRPMLSGPRPVEEIYEERLPWYEEVATVTINTSGLSVKQNAQQVIDALTERGLL